LAQVGPGQEQEDREFDDAEDGEEGVQEGMARADARDMPQSRAEMLTLKAQYRNALHLASHFYGDRYLQLEFRVIFLGARYLLGGYENALQAAKDGKDPTARIRRLARRIRFNV
jgi:hypothetical protein